MSPETFPDDYIPLNGCRLCRVDFTSLDAFDKHLGGTAQDRVHLAPEDVGLELRSTVSGVPRYGTLMTDERRTSLAALKAS